MCTFWLNTPNFHLFFIFPDICHLWYCFHPRCRSIAWEFNILPLSYHFRVQLVLDLGPDFKRKLRHCTLCDIHVVSFCFFFVQLLTILSCDRFRFIQLLLISLLIAIVFRCRCHFLSSVVIYRALWCLLGKKFKTIRYLFC